MEVLEEESPIGDSSFLLAIARWDASSQAVGRRRRYLDGDGLKPALRSCRGEVSGLGHLA